MAFAYQNNAVVLSQPSYSSSSPFREMNGEWNADLMSCCDDMSQCCYAYCCWSCFMLSLVGKIDESALSYTCVPNALAVYRMKVRTALRIRGDSCDDYCATFWCSLCVGIQMQNELRYRGLG